MNIYITHHLQSLIVGSIEMQKNKQTSDFFSLWLQNVSRGWPMQAVARLEICTMRINIALYYCTLRTSNIIVKSLGLQCIGHFGTLLLVYNLFC